MTHDPVSRYDYLWGAASIAEVLNVTTKQAYKLLEEGKVPGHKLGSRWVVTRAELHAFMAKLPSNQPGKPEDAA